ncbi:MAG: rhodanese-like domain-containing protein [Thiohalocapsa sp.]
MKDLNPLELVDLLRQSTQVDQPLLLDVREPWEFGICHIDGSRLVPMRQISAALTEFEIDQPLVVICHHGIRSLQVAQYLEHQGFSQVYNLRGGVDGWARDVDPAMATY